MRPEQARAIIESAREKIDEWKSRLMLGAGNGVEVTGSIGNQYVSLFPQKYESDIHNRSYYLFLWTRVRRYVRSYGMFRYFRRKTPDQDGVFPTFILIIPPSSVEEHGDWAAVPFDRLLPGQFPGYSKEEKNESRDAFYNPGKIKETENLGRYEFSYTFKETICPQIYAMYGTNKNLVGTTTLTPGLILSEIGRPGAEGPGGGGGAYSVAEIFQLGGGSGQISSSGMDIFQPKMDTRVEIDIAVRGYTSGYMSEFGRKYGLPFGQYSKPLPFADGINLGRYDLAIRQNSAKGRIGSGFVPVGITSTVRVGPTPITLNFASTTYTDWDLGEVGLAGEIGVVSYRKV